MQINLKKEKRHQRIERALKNDEALGLVFLKDWIKFRRLHVTAGTCRVGHCDLLALPQG